MEEPSEINEKVKGLIEIEPPSSAPLPSSAGEDDFGKNWMVDEFYNVVTKLCEVVVVKDRFYKMRMFTRCFARSEAVDFLLEDQLLERDEDCVFFSLWFYLMDFFWINSSRNLMCQIFMKKKEPTRLDSILYFDIPMNKPCEYFCGHYFNFIALVKLFHVVIFLVLFSTSLVV